MNRRSLVGIIAGATLLGAAALTVPKFYPEQISYGEYTYSPIAHKIIKDFAKNQLGTELDNRQYELLAKKNDSNNDKHISLGESRRICEQLANEFGNMIVISPNF